VDERPDAGAVAGERQPSPSKKSTIGPWRSNAVAGALQGAAARRDLPGIRGSPRRVLEMPDRGEAASTAAFFPPERTSATTS
jgi:hypothetical protein